MSATRNIAQFDKFIDKGVFVRFINGREVQGVLKGFDTMVNLVLDECIEFVRDPADPTGQRLTDKTTGQDIIRELGIVVCRGTSITYLTPLDGLNEIENPFVQQAEEAENDGAA